MTTNQRFSEAKRTQESLLAPLERRCLVWIASRMPAPINSDHLTALGFGALIVAGALYAIARYWPEALLIANVCLAVNWFGDSLDGTLARVRGKLRPRYGFYVDHVVDAFGALFLLGGIALSGYATPTVAVALLITFLLFSIEVFLATYCLGSFTLSYWKFGPTELRVLLIVGNCFAYMRPTVRLLGRQTPFFDVGFAIAVVAMALTLGGSVVAHTRALYRAERV